MNEIKIAKINISHIVYLSNVLQVSIIIETLIMNLKSIDQEKNVFCVMTIIKLRIAIYCEN